MTTQRGRLGWGAGGRFKREETYARCSVTTQRGSLGGELEIGSRGRRHTYTYG